MTPATTTLDDRVVAFALRLGLSPSELDDLYVIVGQAMREGAAIAKQADADGRAAAKEATCVCVLPGEGS